MQLKLLSAITCLVAGLTSASQGTDGLGTVKDATNSLDKTIDHWFGGPLLIVPILLKTQRLMNSIDNTAVTYQLAGKRSDADESSVVTAAQSAADGVRSLVQTVIASKKKFSNIPFGESIVFGLVKTLEKSTKKLTAGIVDGAPKSSKLILNKTRDQVDEYFKTAIAAFE